jgi:predicted lipid-binding transport protein (Tim44 family)
MTNQEKRAKKEQKNAKKAHQDRMMTGLGYGACAGFIGLVVFIALQKIVWGAVTFLCCIAIGLLVSALLKKKN